MVSLKLINSKFIISFKNKQNCQNLFRQFLKPDLCVKKKNLGRQFQITGKKICTTTKKLSNSVTDNSHERNP